jgi:tRNA nucleotidyltransferase (CCA-adding enzyme)
MGENAFFNLIKVKRADNKAQATDLANKESENIEKLNLIAEEIIRSGECYSLKTLEIDGSDLEKLGFSGKNIGRVLDDVLQKVIRQELENDRAKIISYLNKN